MISVILSNPKIIEDTLEAYLGAAQDDSFSFVFQVDSSIDSFLTR